MTDGRRSGSATLTVIFGETHALLVSEGSGPVGGMATH